MPSGVLTSQGRRCAASCGRCWSKAPDRSPRPTWFTCRAAAGETVESVAATPARLTVYDAPLELDSITEPMRENLDDELTEVKSENAIDRLTAQASARTLERVPAGARFRVRLMLDILCAEDKELAAKLS